MVNILLKNSHYNSTNGSSEEMVKLLVALLKRSMLVVSDQHDHRFTWDPGREFSTLEVSSMGK